jgi:hypothetical protein
MYLSAWRWSVRPKYVAYVDETNTTLLLSTAARVSVLMWCTATGWIPQKLLRISWTWLWYCMCFCHDTFTDMSFCRAMTLHAQHNHNTRYAWLPSVTSFTGGCRKLYNAEFCNKYSSLNITSVGKSRGVGWDGHIARLWEIINAYKILFGNFERKRVIGRPTHRFELGTNVKVDIKEIGESMSRTEVGGSSDLLNTGMYFRFPSRLGNFLNGWTSISFLRSAKLALRS